MMMSDVVDLADGAVAICGGGGDDFDPSVFVKQKLTNWKEHELLSLISPAKIQINAACLFIVSLIKHF